MIESERLVLRKITKDDFVLLSVFLKNPEVMYAWEHGFTDEEVQEWIDRNLNRYEKNGMGYLIAQEKENGAAVGAIGAIFSDINGAHDWEIAYILNKPYWGSGYAKEGAEACIDYVFKTMDAERVLLQIRTENGPSIKTAMSLGAEFVETYNRIYCGKNMPHHVYQIKKGDWLARQYGYGKNVSRETQEEI